MSFLQQYYRRLATSILQMWKIQISDSLKISNNWTSPSNSYQNWKSCEPWWPWWSNWPIVLCRRLPYIPIWHIDSVPYCCKNVCQNTTGLGTANRERCPRRIRRSGAYFLPAADVQISISILFPFRALLSSKIAEKVCFRRNGDDRPSMAIIPSHQSKLKRNPYTLCWPEIFEYSDWAILDQIDLCKRMFDTK